MARTKDGKCIFRYLCAIIEILRRKSYSSLFELKERVERVANRSGGEREAGEGSAGSGWGISTTDCGRGQSIEDAQSASSKKGEILIAD